MKEVPEIEAYRAMYFFLKEDFERGGCESSDIARILSGLSLLEDGKPSDPAFLKDWAEALEKSKSSDSIGQSII